MQIKNLFLLFLVVSSFLFSQNKIALIHFSEGKSVIKNSRYDGRSINAVVGRFIYDNDIIKVNSNSSCYIRFNNDKTHIKVFPNSVIKINDDFNSRKIELIKGNIYIKNIYEENKKTYVFSGNNQLYLSDHRIWVALKDDSSKIFSLDTPVKLYNYDISKDISINIRDLLNIDNGSLSYSNNISETVPNYVLSDVLNFNYNKNEIELLKYDMIPVYGDRFLSENNINPYKISFDFETAFLNSNTYIKLGLYPEYSRKNLFMSMNIESYVSPSGNDLKGDWDDPFDIIDKIQLQYSYNDNKKDMQLQFGEIHNVSFASGYMLSNISNIIDYPRRKFSGFMLDYKFDVDFMDFSLVVPSIRDFQDSGGIIAARTSLFISHSFPLTLGLGLVADMNQLSSISNYFGLNKIKRSVYGAEFDFNYNFVSNLDFQLDLFGEAVGLWYPDYTYYILSDDGDVSDDLRWRKGTWGINGPGISLKFNNRYLFKISLNYNSATFIPNYFNSTYLYNRARYYRENLEQIQFDNSFPLVQKQINLLKNNFQIDCDSESSESDCIYLIPKDVYPILFSNNGFSPYDTYGLSTEFIYNFYKYIDVSVKSSVFIENNDASNPYYTLQTALNINDRLIRNLDGLRFYYSNIFFTKISDKSRMNYGVEFEVDLPMRLSLIINLGQVYYDSNNIIDNNIDKMSNSSLNLKYNF